MRTTDEFRSVLEKSTWEPDGRRHSQDESYAAFKIVPRFFDAHEMQKSLFQIGEESDVVEQLT